MRPLKIREMPVEDRPREKLATLGDVSLSEPELLAILLRTGVSGASAVDVGRDLLDRYGSLTGLSRCSVDELKKIRGVGFAKAVQLVAAFGIGKRLANAKAKNQKLDSPESIEALVVPRCGDYARSLCG